MVHDNLPTYIVMLLENNYLISYLKHVYKHISCNQTLLAALIYAIQKHPGCKKGEAKSEAPVNVKITSESTGNQKD